jgi:hypothetical protein
MLENTDLLSGEASRFRFNVHFDRHLYLPLLLNEELIGYEELKINPPGLEESEWNFVRDLKKFCEELNDGEWEGRELFLLRNQARGSGVGFFLEANNFYPDFLLWVVEGDTQYLNFVDPHGLVYDALFQNPKIHFAQGIKAYEGILQDQLDDVRLHLNSFIVSPTSRSDAENIYVQGDYAIEDPPDYFRDKHILFQKEPEYISEMFELMFEDERVVAKG